MKMAFLCCLAILSCSLFLSNGKGAESGRDCVWGSSNETTTYLEPYCGLMVPDIPVLNRPKVNPIIPIDQKAISPETAIMVRTSDGKCYRYYYTEITRWKNQVPVRVRVRVILPCLDSACAPSVIQPTTPLPLASPAPLLSPSSGGTSIQFHTEVLP